MDAIVIQGGASLRGDVLISGAKNAALPDLAASILAPGPCLFTNVPNLADVRTMLKVLAAMGTHVNYDVDAHTATVDSTGIGNAEASYELVRTMRASVLVLGPLLARFGWAKVSLPGGCAIGARPIDQHLKGLEKLGATITLREGYVHARCNELIGAEVNFDMVTVTGTMNVMMAACLAKGRTTLCNVAREPEVSDLALLLTNMGARISGAGTGTITIDGVASLSPTTHRIIPDRIECGTFMVAAAATRGDVRLRGARAADVSALRTLLSACGVQIDDDDDGNIRVRMDKAPTPIRVETQVHPGFPTDMQAQTMVLSLLADGTSVISERIFENRFMHVPELIRMGAKIDIDGHAAIVNGPCNLSGATVMASDLRASAALIIAGLIANSDATTTVRRVYHLDRGYESIEKKLAALGADIKRTKE